jgi:hypothetical protein
LHDDDSWREGKREVDRRKESADMTIRVAKRGKREELTGKRK